MVGRCSIKVLVKDTNITAQSLAESELLDTHRDATDGIGFISLVREPWHGVLGQLTR